MPAFVYDFTIEQGTTLTKEFIYKDSFGIPIDLTGFTARMQLRPTVASESVLLDLTTENGGIVLGGATGEVKMVFTEADTVALSRGGVYDLELVDGPADYDPEAVNAPTVIRFVQGTITVSKGVTRRVG